VSGLSRRLAVCISFVFLLLFQLLKSCIGPCDNTVQLLFANLYTQVIERIPFLDRYFSDDDWWTSIHLCNHIVNHTSSFGDLSLLESLIRPFNCVGSVELAWEGRMKTTTYQPLAIWLDV